MEIGVLHGSVEDGSGNAIRQHHICELLMFVSEMAALMNRLRNELFDADWELLNKIFLTRGAFVLP
jgi:hypothetical protein